MRETEAKLEATTAALTLRAEAAEHQLQWQEDVLARCSAAEAAHTAAAEEARLREEEVSEAHSLRTCRVASEECGVEARGSFSMNGSERGHVVFAH
jgi:hypothetical protein